MTPEMLEALNLLKLWPDCGTFQERCMVIMHAARRDLQLTTVEGQAFRVAVAVIYACSDQVDRNMIANQLPEVFGIPFFAYVQSSPGYDLHEMWAGSR